jgi:hypothetical protein
MKRWTTWWMLASAALMALGAFGPWATVFRVSVTGTGGGGDGWVVVAVAGLGTGLCYLQRRRRWRGAWALLGGVAGFAVTVYDRGNLETVINRTRFLGQALGHVGWGLDLALVASISMAFAGLTVLLQARSSSDEVEVIPG